uniref:CD209 antigen-like protein E n=1 Tax=Doryrhamphus excisus TaxID=161450 RepID=UPI0025AE05CA|nr:CD209 antigen-like protein E [Doryrhamphus excisus]
MAVVFTSHGPQVSVEIGEYQQFPKDQHDDKTETTPPKSKHIHVFLLAFGILFVLQAVLNITLRLNHSEAAPKGGGETRESCPEDWLLFSFSCYYISSRRKSWDDSRLDCLQRGADLVIINNRQEQAFLTGFAEAAWIGMSDRDQEGKWMWVDGTPVKDKLEWALGQPDGAFGGEDCGELRSMMNFLGLNDYSCIVRSQWICEKPLMEGTIKKDIVNKGQGTRQGNHQE